MPTFRCDALIGEQRTRRDLAVLNQISGLSLQMIWVQVKTEGDRGYVRMVAGPRNQP
jgi:hypothetical protein